MSLPLVDPNALVDASNLTTLSQAAAAHNPQALREAAQQFESLFTSMVLKSMRQADFGDSLFGSDQVSLYQGMYDDQIAAEISKGRGLGLADMLVQQLRRSGLPGAAQAGATDAATPAAATASTGTTSTSPTASTGSTAARAAAAQGATPMAVHGGGVPGPDTLSGRSSLRDSPSPAASAASAAANSCPSTAQQLAFARSLWPQAQQAARQLGVSPVSVVAQAALETDWGRSVPRDASGSTSNNLFGIKAGAGWSGTSVQAVTQEYEGGTATTVKAQFRAYATPGQCFKDYVALLQSNPRYAAALGTGENTQAFAAALQRAGYATDPAYAGKLGAVANTLSRTLTQGAQGAAGAGDPGAALLKSAISLPTTSGSNTL